MSIPLVESVGRKLGGAEVVGHDVRSQADLASVVRARLPLRVLRNLAEAGFGPSEIETLIIPERTRRHRAQKGQPLTVEESDRVVRLLRIQTLAEETFGSPDKAAGWLRRPLGELGAEAPLFVAQTGAGARVIETILGQIAWGAAA
jgi:putative toxin-antitoxin system antitoxin component (TIGR02293 family)